MKNSRLSFRRGWTLLLALAALGMNDGEDSCSPINSLDAVEPIGQNSVTLQWYRPYDWVGTPQVYLGKVSEQDPAAVGTMDTWWNGAQDIAGLPLPAEEMQSEQAEVTGLLPGRTYYFSLRALDASGDLNQGYGNVVQATTDPDLVAPGAPTNLSALTLGSQSIRLSWTASGDDAATGTAWGYEVKVSENSNISNPGLWWGQASGATGEVPAPLVSTTHQSMDLIQLQPSKTYTLAIRAIDDGGQPSPIAFVGGAVTEALQPGSGGGKTDGGGCGARGDAGSGALILLAAVACFSAADRRTSR